MMFCLRRTGLTYDGIYSVLSMPFNQKRPSVRDKVGGLRIEEPFLLLDQLEEGDTRNIKVLTGTCCGWVLYKTSDVELVEIDAYD